MLKNELKLNLAVMGTLLIPAFTQADQPMSSTEIQQSAYVQGERIKDGQLPAGYNASASFQCANQWDIFITGDYIYWAWNEDTLKVAELRNPSLAANGNYETFYVNPGYASGFQVGAGFNMPGMDDWNLYSEYTWYKNSASKSVSNGSSEVIHLQEPMVTPNSYYLNGTVSSEVKISFDALDLLLKRPFYLGKKLTANFAAGLSALWITEHGTKDRVGLGGILPTSLPNFLSSEITVKQTSWGLGPKFGIESNWMLGFGLQIMANLSASLLYTQYNVTGSHNGTIIRASTVTDFTTTITPVKNLGTIRPITEAFLGLGWGSGLCNDAFRIAVSAGYDFNVYWDQNMQNYSTNQTGNMYLQGLNVAARFDF